MAGQLVDQIFEDTYEILESHAMFYHPPGTPDEHRHYIPHEAIVFLAWIAAGVAVPILTSVSSSVIAEQVKRRLNRKQSLPSIKEELENILNTSPDSVLSAETVARASLAKILADYGWPPETADHDAEQIVSTIIAKLSSGRP